MQESKWSPSQESVPSYTSYPPPLYRDMPHPSNVSMATTTETLASGDASIPGLMSLTQPETPRPDATSLPPTPIASSISSRSPSNSTSSSGEGAAVARPNLPTRPASFTSMTSFPSHPYHQFAGPIRKRRAESIFSFEMGPSFSSTEQLHDLVSLDQTNGFQVQLHAKMDRGFFRADQDWACYRRNYFQVSSTFDVHGVNYLLQGPEVPCLLRLENDQLHQVEFFSIGASACVSGKPDKKIELVMMTPKRDKGPQMIPRPQPVRAGGNLHLASVGSSHHIVTFERMQFKTATANNGKRRAAQQYYEIIIDLYANTSQGQQIRVATCHSSPLVVRGRSPGHYADSHTRYRHNSMASSTTGGDDTTATAIPSHPQEQPTIMGSHHDHRLPPPPPPQPGRYMSLPTSPISDLGPYSPYYGYPPPPPPPLAAGYTPSSPSYSNNNYTIPSHHHQQQAATTPSSSHHHPDYFHQPTQQQQQQQQPDYYAYKDFSHHPQESLGYPPTGIAPPPPPPLQQQQQPSPAATTTGHPYHSYTPYTHSAPLAQTPTTIHNQHHP